MAILLFLVSVGVTPGLAEETTTGRPGPLRITITPSPFSGYENMYPPRCNRFVPPSCQRRNSEGVCVAYDYSPADACAPEGWVPTVECPNPDQVDRAERLMALASQFIHAHGYLHSEGVVRDDGTRGFTYEARTLVCKMFRESTFRPNVEAFSSNSSAGGLAQVTESTAYALMEGPSGRPLNFRSQIPAFHHITTGAELYEAMSRSIALQVEVGLAVLQMKNLEGNAGSNYTSGIRQLLERYYGGPGKEEYAADIIECSRCIGDNNNEVQFSCLRQAQGRSGSCQ